MNVQKLILSGKYAFIFNHIMFPFAVVVPQNLVMASLVLSNYENYNVKMNRCCLNYLDFGLETAYSKHKFTGAWSFIYLGVDRV